jgi:hypothetical protein
MKHQLRNEYIFYSKKIVKNFQNMKPRSEHGYIFDSKKSQKFPRSLYPLKTFPPWPQSQLL